MTIRKTVSKDTTTITTFEELQEVYTLEEILSALHNKEMQRVYHKTQYLKRQALLLKAKEMGLDKEDLNPDKE